MRMNGQSVAIVEDAIPTTRLLEICELADRAQVFWAEVAKMVQLCHDANLGSWKELRAMKPRKLEELCMVAAKVLAGRERERERKAKAAAEAEARKQKELMVPHLADIQRAEIQRRTVVLAATVRPVFTPCRNQQVSA